MRSSFFVLTVVLACVSLAGCGESAASRKAEAARLAAEERAIAAEKALADQNAVNKKLESEKSSSNRAQQSLDDAAAIPQLATIADASQQVQPKDAKLTEFQAEMNKFIDEARSFARSMELLPDRDAYKKRIASLEEVYSRIPDSPPGNEALAMCYKAARQITVNFKGGDLYLKFIDDFLRLNSKEGADKSVMQFRELGTKQRADLDELEAAVTAGRVPRIELSDVIRGTK